MFMKILELNKKVQKNQGAILTKLLVCHLIIALEYQTRYTYIYIVIVPYRQIGKESNLYNHEFE